MNKIVIREELTIVVVFNTHYVKEIKTYGKIWDYSISGKTNRVREFKIPIEYLKQTLLNLVHFRNYRKTCIA